MARKLQAKITSRLCFAQPGFPQGFSLPGERGRPGAVEKGRVRLLPNRNAVNIPDFERFGRSLTLPKIHFMTFSTAPSRRLFGDGDQAP